MNLTIRARLTLLYSLVLGASFLAFFWICDMGFRHSIETTVNDESRSDLETVRRVINDSAPRGTAKLREELGELSELWANGAIFQVAGANNEILYQSPRFLRPDFPFPPFRDETFFFNRNLNHFQYRIARQRIKIGGTEYFVDAAVPTEPFDQALDRFRVIEKEFLPLLVLLASLLGYWLGGRALAPVNRIIKSAKEIGVRNLHQRLEVPETKDELRQLTETVNAMLARIDSSVNRITQFTADASHDLRTPLALIRTNAELALRRTRTEAEYRDTLIRILKSAEETTELIEHLLTLARADAGAAQLKFATVELHSILERACRQARVLASAKNLSFTADYDENRGADLVYGDSSALERLFLTILDNAVKYTPSGGAVSVRAQIVDGQAIIEIEDTGLGIPADELARIFDRFYRADQSRSREIRGSGLGLAIARWIVEMHRGTVQAESRVGEGTRMRITLPTVTGVTTSEKIAEEIRSSPLSENSFSTYLTTHSSPVIFS
ncbi:MAG TPA: ATP-binding protein [Candidatus Acidoferrum sp.]|nr:ATP-binding protein [Candidatus Acidoferrum sp.]